MNRKHFLHTIIPATLAATLFNRVNAASKKVEQATLIPPFLKSGDTVGITCPASPTEYNKLIGIKAVKNWGLNVQVGKTVGKHWQRFAGTDLERAADLQAMLDDDNIKAIFFAKGGYGTMRMIDKIVWDNFIEKPKWLIGYSDVTTVHLHVHNNFEIPTIHGDMITGFTENPKDISANTLHDILFGNRVEYSVGGHYMNREGYASGKLIGGNLSLLQACAGSPSDINTNGKILFIEDVSEYKYTIDRMLMNLKRSGKLSNLAGLVVGQFTATKKNEEEPFPASIEEIIMDKVSEYNYPVCFNFPSGHVPYNYALKMGVTYDFNVSTKNVTLFENFAINAPVPNAPSKMLMDTLPIIIENKPF
jgi:muramoyltetrapeptide carboxypeptidase